MGSGGILSPVTDLLFGEPDDGSAQANAVNQSTDKSAEATRYAADRAAQAQLEAANIASETAKEQARLAAEATTRAAELARQGQVAAARIAAAEAKRAQEATIAYQKEATAKAITLLDNTLGQASGTIKEAQTQALSMLESYGSEAAELYRPYVEAGTAALSELQTMAETGVQVPSDLTESPYYSLYKYEQEQQQKSIDKALAARGLYNSGYGIGEQVKADTGLTEAFAAQEYERAVADYVRKATLLSETNAMGYGATEAQANIQNNLGANLASVYQWGGGNLANLESGIGQAKANAELGLGSNLSNISMSTGDLLANIATNLGNQQSQTALTEGSNQASIYNSLGSTLGNIQTNLGSGLSNIYANQGNILSQLYANQGSNLANIYNQAAQNRTSQIYNVANLALGGTSAYLGYRGWQDYLKGGGGYNFNNTLYGGAPSAVYSSWY